MPRLDIAMIALGKPVIAKPSQPTTTNPTVQFEASNLQSAYANVCNVSSTLEEVVLAFGVNTVWEHRRI